MKKTNITPFFHCYSIFKKKKDYIADIVKDNTYRQEQGLFKSCYNKKKNT